MVSLTEASSWLELGLPRGLREVVGARPLVGTKISRAPAIPAHGASAAPVGARRV
jgi:hypothetical protein